MGPGMAMSGLGCDLRPVRRQLCTRTWLAVLLMIGVDCVTGHPAWSYCLPGQFCPGAPVYRPYVPPPVYHPYVPPQVYHPYVPPPVYNPPVAVYHPPVSIYRPPTAVYHPPTAVYHPPVAVYHPPTAVAVYHPPTAVHHPPSVAYRPSPIAYRAPVVYRTPIAGDPAGRRSYAATMYEAPHQQFYYPPIHLVAVHYDVHTSLKIRDGWYHDEWSRIYHTCNGDFRAGHIVGYGTLHHCWWDANQTLLATYGIIWSAERLAAWDAYTAAVFATDSELSRGVISLDTASVQWAAENANLAAGVYGPWAPAPSVFYPWVIP